MSIITGEAAEFLSVVNKDEKVKDFFNQFETNDLFSLNWTITLQTLNQMKPIPKEILKHVPEFGMSYLSKYMIIIIPSFFPDQLLQTFLLFLDKLPLEDLNLVVSLIISRLSESQRQLAIFQLPDCGSTFQYLGSMLNSQDLFLMAFQRIFSSFNLVPSNVRPILVRDLRYSIKNGPARNFIFEIIDITLHHSGKLSKESKKNGYIFPNTCIQDSLLPFELVLQAIVDFYPDSLVKTDPNIIQNSINTIFKASFVPVAGLQLLLLTNSQLIMSFHHIISFVRRCPTVFFEFLARLPDNDSLSTWYLILVKGAAMEVNFATQDFLVTIIYHFLIASLNSNIFISVLPSTGCIEWFMNFLNSMTDSLFHVALLGLFLMITRCFGEISKLVLDNEKFASTFEAAITRIPNKIVIYDTILWVLDPTRKAPFYDLVENTKLSRIPFPPPSSTFVFQMVPIILPSLMRIAISDSTPKNQPQTKTPMRMNLNLEKTHSLIKLNLDDSCDESSSEGFVESSCEDLPAICSGNVDELTIKPLLEFFLTSLIPMYKDDSLSSLLYALSSSQVLLPILPFAHGNDLCFNFLCRALALSCPFPVFATFFEQLSDNFAKKLLFLANLAENSQLVTDFLYVTCPIPLSTTTPCNSIVIWMRPLSESNVLTFSTKAGDFMVRVTPTEMDILLHKKRILLPPKIGGWVMVTVTISGSVVTFSANLSQVKVQCNVESPGFQNIVIGTQTSHFDLQSVRIFKNTLSEEDILYLFALGPDFREFVNSNLLQMECNTTSAYVTDSGFVSTLYIPFLKDFNGKSLESNAMSMMELSLSPPFKSVRHLARGPQKQATSISLDRRRSYSFMNAFHCHGGIHLLLHFAGEILLKLPENGSILWRLLSRLINYRPEVHRFFEDTHAYALIGHLLWAGNSKAEDTIDLAMSKLEGKWHFTNPYIVRDWLLEGQIFHGEFEDIIINIMDSLSIQRNMEILQWASAFTKIVNLLCSPCTHSSKFLTLLGNFAVMLTNQKNAQENAQLVFDRLILSHFSFANNEKENEQNHHMPRSPSTNKATLYNAASSPKEIQPRTTCALIMVLEKILSIYPEVHSDLKLFLPAIVTSPPEVQVSLVNLLLKHLSSEYLQLLGHILKILPHIEGIENSIFTLLESLEQLDFVKLTTCFSIYFCHEESCEYIERFCSLANDSTVANNEQIVIAMNQVIDTIYFTEKAGGKLPLFDDISAPVSNFIALLLDKAITLNIPDTLLRFLLSVFSIPNVPIYRLANVCITATSSLLKLMNSHNQALLPAVEKAIQHITTFGSFLMHKLRLTPGAINQYIFNNIAEFINSLFSIIFTSQSSDSINRLINFLADFYHLDIPLKITNSIKQSLFALPKASKAKRYSEMIDRMEEPSMLTPNKFIVPFQDEIDAYTQKWMKKDDVDLIALFSISCCSIHHQTLAAVTIDTANKESDAVIDLWHDIFHILQFPGSSIFSGCPVKWMVSDRSSNFQQRAILIPMNPSIDKQYMQYWDTKYAESAPNIKLSLHEVLRYTPTSLHVANDVKFSSHAHRLSGISNFDGVVVVLPKKIRFYQQNKASLDYCEIVLTIPMSKVISVRLKTFRHQPTGVEITCKDSTCYLFAFDTVNLRDIFVDIMAQSNIQIIRSINKKELNETTKKWCDGLISNFDYLLYLNQLSGRSWNDFTQYPIFPWIIKDYSSEKIDVNNPEVYRDLTYPIFAQDDKQKEQCMYYYRTTENLSNEPHCTPNYISNVGSTIYFLVRVEPFTDEEITFQNGSLDAADRTFQEFNISYALMTSPGNKNALELVPEFYFNSDVLRNINHINFPMSPITGRTVDAVVLPHWAKSHRQFVQIMREALESPIVSSQLHEWIDLVWGFRRRGEMAFERYNVYQSTVYEFDPREVIDDRILFKAIRGQIHNCGQAAAQVFYSPHPKRSCTYQKVEGKLVFHSIRKPIASEKQLLTFSTSPERWVTVLSDKTQLQSIRLVQGSLEASKNGIVVPAVNFSDDISVTCFDLMGTTLVTGHSMPIINLWKIRDNFEHIMSLRGHLVCVSSISIFGQPWSMLAAGHEDGAVSLFSMNPVRFLRALQSDCKIKVAFTRCCISNGDIIVCQTKDEQSVISLWSVNGEFVSTVTLQTKVIDAISTSFVEGTKTNYLFLLCADNRIITFKEHDLQVISTQKLNHPSPASLFIPKEKSVLFVTHEDGLVSCWKIL